jgi:phenylalanyl-tRNA synthetase alpha chain
VKDRRTVQAADGISVDYEATRQQALAQIAAAQDLDAVEGLRIALLGKQGSISGLLKTLGAMPPEQRQGEGPLIHGLRKAELEAAALAARLAREHVDLSLPAPETPRGSIHPVSQVMDELAEIFADLGFAVASGPEIEDDWHNFTALNMPESHPARAMHDTFYFRDRNAEGREMLLRTHTSPVQIRSMLAVSARTSAGTSGGAPLRIIAPGRVYRSDSDATHTPMFHQIEGLVIDRGIHLGHLKWTLETLLKAFFERDDIVLRLRPSYFPFTEPSVEVDTGYSWAGGRRVVGGSGDAPGHSWMELLGSGMVSRHVLTAGGLDPEQWQGFAFGVGVDRLAMLKYGMSDLRAFFDGDARWLSHYGFAALDVPTLSGGVGTPA